MSHTLSFKDVACLLLQEENDSCHDVLKSLGSDKKQSAGYK